MPVKRFLAAVNANEVFHRYLQSGQFVPAPTRKTLSNAMDVGNPSNFARIMDLYDKNHIRIREDITSESVSDAQTIRAIEQVHDQYRYILDPHGAVGFAATQKMGNDHKITGRTLLLETAHPAKFIDVLPERIAAQVKIPARLQSALDKTKKAERITAEYDGFKDQLIKLLR